MTYIISKIVGALINPIIFTILALSIAFVGGLIGWRKTASTIVGFLLIYLCLIVFTPLPNAIILPLEQSFSKPELPESVDGIMSIGGGLEPRIAFGRDSIEQANASDRLYETAVLAMKYPNAKVVYTGATWSVDGVDFPSGEIARRYLVGLGIDNSRITIQANSRNTYDDVILSKKLLQPKASETWVAVTSAYHMPRTIGLFRKQGWSVIPWPSDYQTHGPGAAYDFGYSPTSNLETYRAGVREWVGLISYWMLGRTSELLPREIKNQGIGG